MCGYIAETADNAPSPGLCSLFPFWFAFCLCFGYGEHVDELATVASFRELHGSAHQSIKSVVFADAYVQAGVVDSAALTFDDVAGFGELSAENFYTESFAF